MRNVSLCSSAGLISYRAGHLEFCVDPASALASAPAAVCRGLAIGFHGTNDRLWEENIIPWSDALVTDATMELTGRGPDRYGNIWEVRTLVRADDAALAVENTADLLKRGPEPWDGGRTGWGSLGLVTLRFSLGLSADPATSWNMIPGLLYAGNRSDLVVPRAYCPTLTHAELEELGSHKRPLRVLADITRLDAGTGWRVEMLGHNPASPDLLCLDRETRTGLHVQIERKCRHGWTGAEYVADPVAGRHRLTLQGPGTRDRRYCCCRFLPPADQLNQDGQTAQGARPVQTNLDLAFRIGVAPCEDVPQMVRTYRNSWQHRRKNQSVPETSPASEVARVGIQKFDAENWDEQRGFYWLITVRDPREVSPNMVLQLGWVWGLVVMRPLYSLGAEKTKSRVLRMLAFLMDSGCQSPLGLFYGNYDGEAWMPARGWMGWLDSMAACACRTPDTVRHGLRLLDAIRPDAPELAARWEECLKMAVRALASVFQRHGEIPYLLDPDTGDAVWKGGGGGAMVIEVWCEAARRWGWADMLEHARAYAEKLHAEQILTGDPWGRPVDCYTAGDHETAHALLCAFLALHKATGEQRYLEWGCQAGDLLLTWQVTENITYPEGSRLARNGIHSFGTMIANTQNSTGVPTPCTNSASELIDLYEATGDPTWMDLLADWRRCGLQQLVREGQDWGHLKPGHVTECQAHSDTMSEFGDVYISESGWVLAAFLLQSLELPSIYIDGDRAWALDHLRVIHVDDAFMIENPTAFDADLKIRWRDGHEQRLQLRAGRKTPARRAEAQA